VLAPRRGARGGWLFTMQDVVLLRAAAALRDKLSARRLHHALRAIRAQLPAGRALTSVQILADGDRVVVHDGRRAWEAGTGQGLLALDAQDVAAEVAPLARAQFRAARDRDQDLDAERWYELACDLETGSPDEARRAYERAIELDPAHADARVNLGRLLHEAGDAAGAVAQYRAALAAGGDRETLATAAFNLGVACEDLEDLEAARTAYETSIAFDPCHADAHYNLGCLLERAGNKPGAVRHLREYRRLQGAGGAAPVD
jgi:tetratricopeptide (TPR) repeat protein